MLDKRTADGFTLLEVMIALVIFSIGLIGLAGLQGLGMKNNQTSYTRTVASQLAYDLADRIRNNPGVNYDGLAASNSPNCITSACTSSEMAAFDLFEWNASLTSTNNNFINPVGFVTRAGTTYTISIGWDEDSTVNSTPTSCNPPTPSDITCVTIIVEP